MATKIAHQRTILKAVLGIRIPISLKGVERTEIMLAK
jgi:hypothetical protein